MLLPLFDGLIQTHHFDGECAELADRHYSRRTVGARQFCYSGRKLVLRNAEGSVVWVWMYPDAALRMDGQTGYGNVLFRNESGRRSSEIIIEAERLAVVKWGQNRGYTYIDPTMVASKNPGYCFKMAGWEFVRRTPTGKHLLVKANLGVL